MPTPRGTVPTTGPFVDTSGELPPATPALRDAGAVSLRGGAVRKVNTAGDAWEQVSGGQSADQVRTLITAALDALLGDESVDIDVLAGGRAWQGTRAEDSAQATVVNTASLLMVAEYTVPENLRMLAAGGESFTLVMQAINSLAAIHGFEPLVQLVIQLSSDVGSFGDAQIIDLPADAVVPIDYALPAAWWALGDPAGDDNDLYITVTARATIRSLSGAGTVRLFDAAINGVGTHQTELDDFVERLIDATVNPLQARLDAADAAFRSEIADINQNLVTATQRRILALFRLIQDISYEPYAAEWRVGSQGDFNAAASTFTPTGASIDVRIPISEANQFLSALAIRQDDANGVPQDQPFAQHGVGNDETRFIYRFAVRANVEVNIVRLVRADNLQVLKDVQELLARLNDLSGHLGAAALAMLDGLSTADVRTRAVARTTLLPHLTAARETLTGSGAGNDQDPWVSPALDGGEYIMATRSPSGSRALVEAFLSDAAKINLIEIDTVAQGSRSFQRLTVPYLRPAQAARAANETVYLTNARGDVLREFRLNLTDFQGVARDGEFYFAVPDALAANTDVVVTIRSFANDNEVAAENRNITIAAGGAATGAQQTYVVDEWTIGVRYLVVSGRKLIEVTWIRDPARAHSSRRYLLASAAYTASMNVPAVPESIERQTIYQGASFDTYGALAAVKVEGGNIVLVLEDAPGHGFLEGDFDTGLPAARYGLQAGGTGTLRFTNAPYRELVHVTAGDLTAADLAMLRAHVNAEEFGIGLFSQADEDDRVYRFDRAIQAPAFFSDTMVDGTPASVGRNVFVADASLVSYDAAGNFIRVSAPDIPDAKDIVIFFQLGAAVIAQIDAEADSQQIGIRLGAASTTTRLLRRIENDANVNMTAGRFPKTPVRYIAQTSGGNVNCFILEEQVDFASPAQRLFVYDATDTYTAGDVVIVPANTPNFVPTPGVHYVQAGLE